MKPDATRVLEQAVQALAAEILPAVQPAYQQASVGAWAMLLQITRDELERGAAMRVEENAALRSLVGRGAELVDDADLAARLRAAAEGADPGLRVSELDGAGRELRALLVELHARVEEIPGASAEALSEAIWAELARSTERRRIALAPF